MRAIVDTTVLVSGLISRTGPPARIVDLWVNGAITVLVSSDLVAEYREVLLRPAFGILGSRKERVDLLERLLVLDNVQPVETRDRLAVIKQDPGDNVILECAVGGSADVIVTGDKDLLALKEFRGIAIVSPAEFLRMFK